MMLDPKQRAGAAMAWWRKLQPYEVDGKTFPGERATLAHLRRAGTIMQACTVAATFDLCRQLEASQWELETVALTAAILAHIRTDAPGRFAGQLGAPQGKPVLQGKPALSPLRFQRLIEATEPEAQLAAFRRAIALLDRRASVRDLAESLLDWNDRRRQRWLYDYYRAQDPAQPSTQHPSPDTETPE